MNSRPISPLTLPFSGKEWIVAEPMEAQPSLFNVRIGTVYPSPPPGRDITFWGEAEQGGIYYCKDDRDSRPIRSLEWFFTQLARHLSFATPDPAIIEHGSSGQTYFGSLQVPSAASDTILDGFLSSPRLNEVGGPSSWPGSYLSSLFAYDMFIGNWDRSRRNLILYRDGLSARLCAFDFASSSFDVLSGTNFPVATDPTKRIGRMLRQRHGVFRDSAIEMIDRISAVPADTIADILRPMPADWMEIEQRNVVRELWSKGRILGRLAALRSGINDGSLL